MKNNLPEIWVAGALRPDPHGHAAASALIKQTGQELIILERYIGHGEKMTGNVASYMGVILALEWLIANKIEGARLFSDSEMVVRQMNGKWKAKKGSYLWFYQHAAAMRVDVPDLSFELLPVTENYPARRVASLVVDRVRGVAKGAFKSGDFPDLKAPATAIERLDRRIEALKSKPKLVRILKGGEK